MRAMPFGRTGVRHRLHHLVLGAERAGAVFGFRAHGTKGVPPQDPRVSPTRVRDGCGIVFIASATKDR
jgi:hypothetical protein